MSIFTPTPTALKKIHRLTLAITLISLFNLSYGQIKPPDYEIALSSIISEGDQAPFWLISNRQGKYLPGNYAASLEFGLFAEPDTGKVFDYGYGFDFYGRIGDNHPGDMLKRTFGGNGTSWVHQAYGQFVLYDLIQVKGGMWEETIGSYEPLLSSGSIIWSGNARPMPKIEIGSPGYITIPYTGGYVEMKGVMSHGWFEEGGDNGRYASNVWLHNKNAYMRVGGSLPVNFHYGFNHYAQWGGSSPSHGDYPSDFDSFVKVFFNQAGDEDDEDTPEGWIINKFGNTLGSRNIGLDLNINNLEAGIYLQDVFEDRSGLLRRNFPDGLWGLWIRFPEEKRPLQAIVYEYLQTTYQSGRYHDLDGVVLGGNDNYFNHGHYRSGWTYHKYTIGTPLITSTLLNDPPNQRIMNNRVKAHHIGFEGHITGNTRYRSLITYSRNYGTYDNPFDKRRDQLSLMLEITKPLNIHNLQAGITLAADAGEMYGNSLGVFFTIRRAGAVSGER